MPTAGTKLGNVTTRKKDPDQLGWLVNISKYLTQSHFSRSVSGGGKYFD
jgi:hypothetical protein